MDPGERGGERAVRAPALRPAVWGGPGRGRVGGQEERRVPPGPQRHRPKPAGQARSQGCRGAVRKGGGPRAGAAAVGAAAVGGAERSPEALAGWFAGVAAALAMRTLWMVLCALARLPPGVLAGCAEAGRCCPGRDPACFARGWRLDRVYGTCFCDQACRLTGDCCFDYDRACPGGWLGPGRDR